MKVDQFWRLGRRGWGRTELQVEPVAFQPPQDNLSNRVRNLVR